MLKYHIKTVELATAQAFVQFDSIPQDYSDLVVLMSARSSQSSRSTAITFAFNYDNSSSYSFRRLIGYDSSQVYTGSGSGTPAQVPEIDVTGNSATANTFGNTSFYISNYTSASAKSVSVDQTSENNSSNAYVLGINSYLYSSANPITSIQFGLQGHNYMAGTTISLYGVRRGSDGKTSPVAQGGVVTTSGGYTIHTFNSSGTFTAFRPLECEYLVVAGGGGAHQDAIVSGGAGGYRSSVAGEMSGGGVTAESKVSLTPQSYAIVVGAGGSSSSKGSDSVFESITSLGGGSGDSAVSNTRINGGSGSGSFLNQPVGTGTAGQGFAGGTGTVSSGGTTNGGGGGGASQVGFTAPNNSSAGNGGNGVSSSITGSAVVRAGGGGGGYYSNSVAPNFGTGLGGSGGGGRGMFRVLADPSNPGSRDGQNGVANTGGGSGGGAPSFGVYTLTGGSGVVIIRYLTP